MSEWVLYLGNRNYSSWSMRAWLALKQSGLEFEEVRFHLGRPGVRDEIARYCPTHRVPALHHRTLVIWDSLAIAEYVAEQVPRAGLWPSGREPRAVARAIVAEMHSGFADLRREMPFNVRRSSPGAGRSPAVAGDIERIRQIWRGLLMRAGREPGAFLFGSFTLADAFFAPVVSRFHTYAVELDGVCASYAAAVREHPWVEQWSEDARNEDWVEPQFDL